MLSNWWLLLLFSLSQHFKYMISSPPTLQKVYWELDWQSPWRFLEHNELLCFWALKITSMILALAFELQFTQVSLGFSWSCWAVCIRWHSSFLIPSSLGLLSLPTSWMAVSHWNSQNMYMGLETTVFFIFSLQFQMTYIYLFILSSTCLHLLLKP